MAHIFAYSVRSQDNHGLDPERFEVVVAVHRKDGSALTEAELVEARAALAPLAAPQREPTTPPNPLEAYAAKGSKATGTDG